MAIPRRIGGAAIRAAAGLVGVGVALASAPYPADNLLQMGPLSKRLMSHPVGKLTVRGSQIGGAYVAADMFASATHRDSYLNRYAHKSSMAFKQWKSIAKSSAWFATVDHGKRITKKQTGYRSRGGGHTRRSRTPRARKPMRGPSALYP
jgi:hypothetical protein